MAGPTVGPAERVRVGAGSCRCCVWGMRRSTVVCRAEQDLTSSVFLLCSSLRSILPAPSCFRHPPKSIQTPTSKRLDTSACFAFYCPQAPDPPRTCRSNKIRVRLSRGFCPSFHPTFANHLVFSRLLATLLSVGSFPRLIFLTHTTRFSQVGREHSSP